MEGEIEKRAGTLMDRLPKPYPNEAAAKFSNGGAMPPDLTLIAKGRDGGENYIFSLLTAYHRELPAGVTSPRDGLFWNPYFSGGWISMPPPLSDDMVDYFDGTPATVSQMAKDVCCFLAWSSEPWMDEKKYLWIKCMMSMAILVPTTMYWMRTRFNVAKLRRHKIFRLGNL
eukprot:Sspe_Gene.26619::Locus_11146_Transcript_1_1_Confidence_1.000_Length_853::g.26619::m.26619/K00413/CYC1, CYT1, petC; ubiquinol-cytochrome c reductase cytochrome c1 subunit